MRFDANAGTFTPLHAFAAAPGSGYLAFGRGGTRVLRHQPDSGTGDHLCARSAGALQRMNEVMVPAWPDPPTWPSIRMGASCWSPTSQRTRFDARAGTDGAVGDAIDVQQTAPEAHQVVCTKDGRFLFVALPPGDVVCQFVVDPAAQAGSQRSVHGPREGGRRAAPHGVHPSQRFAFVLNELDGTMTSIDWNRSAGSYPPAHVASVPDGFAERAPLTRGASGWSLRLCLEPPARQHRHLVLRSRRRATAAPRPRDSWRPHQITSRFHLGPSGTTLLVANEAGGLCWPSPSRRRHLALIGTGQRRRRPHSSECCRIERRIGYMSSQPRPRSPACRPGSGQDDSARRARARKARVRVAGLEPVISPDTR